MKNVCTLYVIDINITKYSKGSEYIVISVLKAAAD